MKKQILSLIFALLVCLQAKAFDAYPELDYPNSQAAEIGQLIKPSVPSIVLVSDQEHEKPVRQITPELRTRMRDIDTTVNNARSNNNGVLTFGRTDQDYRDGLSPRPSAVIIVAPDTSSMNQLNVAQEMVLNFLRNYDEAIENLELSLIYGYEGDLRSYALAQSSLEFFQLPATISEYNNYLIEILSEEMASDSSVRSEQASEIADYIQENYIQGHFPLDFLEQLAVQN